MPSSDCDVLVVGAGVSGLTTAICLAEAGLRAVIQAAAPPARTTSSVAGAIWGPHLVEDSPRATRWRRDTLAVLRDLAAEPGTGVRIVTGVEAARGDPPPPGPPPDWLRDLGGATPSTPGSLPPGFSSGWRYSAPLAHMPTYLGYLQARFEKAAGRVETATVRTLAGAARERGARVVVNCTGAGAHGLVPDPALTAFRGQVVVAANPGITEFFIGPADVAGDLVYLFPHGDTVVLGGTEVAGDWSTEPVPALAERILRDCAVVEPRLRGAAVLDHRVGLRPFRPRIRLEAEVPRPEAPDREAPRPGTARPGTTQPGTTQPGTTQPGTTQPGATQPGTTQQSAEGPDPLVVHNYGHGGAGITMSWGCAREAAALVTQALSARPYE